MANAPASGGTVRRPALSCRRPPVQGGRETVLSADESTRIGATLDANSDGITGRWAEAELHKQIQELAHGTDERLARRAVRPFRREVRRAAATLSELSRSRARQGFTATETAIRVYGLRDALVTVMDIHSGDRHALADFVAVSGLIDQLGPFTFEAYAKNREELISNQAEQLLELATPVVKLRVAARLMGTECVISGIRPQIAKTMVALGIDFGDIATKATLADALRHALRMIQASKQRSS